MNENLVVKVSTTIDAPPAKVWQALTDPKMIEQYLFGTHTITDWKVGGPIRWQGSYEGKSYEDKGTVLQFVPEKLLQNTYWSSMGGLADTPENYKKVTYELAPRDGGTQVTLTQDNNETEADRAHSEQNWKMVLEGLKKMVENQ